MTPVRLQPAAPQSPVKHSTNEPLRSLREVDGTPSQIPTFFTFDLYLGVKVTQNVAEYPLHRITYAHAQIEVATSNG